MTTAAGVTAERRQGGASLSDVVPAAGEAGEPGTNGNPGRREAEGRRAVTSA